MFSFKQPSDKLILFKPCFWQSWTSGTDLLPLEGNKKMNKVIQNILEDEDNMILYQMRNTGA